MIQPVYHIDQSVGFISGKKVENVSLIENTVQVSNYRNQLLTLPRNLLNIYLQMLPLEMLCSGGLEWGHRICIFKQNKQWMISKQLSLSHSGLNQRWILVLVLYLRQIAVVDHNTVVLASSRKRCRDDGLCLVFILAKVIQR